MAVFCTKCGTQNEDFSQNCSQCGAALPVISGRPSGKTDYAPPYEPGYQPIQPPSALYSQPAAQNCTGEKLPAEIVVGARRVGWALPEEGEGLVEDGQLFTAVDVERAHGVRRAVHAPNLRQGGVIRLPA